MFTFNVLLAICGFAVIRGFSSSRFYELTARGKLARAMSESAKGDELMRYKKSTADLEKQLKDLQKDYENLAAENQKLRVENDELRKFKEQQDSKTSGGAKASHTNAPHGDSSAQERVRQLEADIAEKDEEIQRLRKHESDLLHLLTKQDIKCNKLKNRLFDLGEALEASDDDELENGN